MIMSTYNGWTNYATWRVNLEIFDGMTAEDFTGGRIPAPSELKDDIRAHAEELIESTSSEGLARDYAMAFLSDVNWWEIADHLTAACEPA
jgi:hypothetical protein